MSLFDHIPTATGLRGNPDSFSNHSRWRWTAFLLAFILAFGILFRPQGPSPVDTYHAAWQAVPAYIFDQDALKDWQSWEHRYDSRIHSQADAVKYANEMLASLHDQYTMLLDRQQTAAEDQEEQGNFVGVGMSLGAALDAAGNVIPAADGSPMPVSDARGYPVIVQVTAGSPAARAGLASRFVITSIDGKDVRGHSLRQLVIELRGAPKSTVVLGVSHDGQRSSVTLIRQEIATNPVAVKMLSGNIAYIRLDSFDQSNAADLFQEAMAANENASAYIIDLRDNPGGIGDVAFNIASLFLDHGTVATFKMRVPGQGYETETVKLTPDHMVSEVSGTGSSKVEARQYARKPDLSAGKPVVILVNGNTASAAELFTGALKDNGRATVIGTRTFGKGIGQGYVDLPGSVRLHITVGRYYTPGGAWLGDGGNSVQQGIEPTVRAADPTNGGAGGSDSQLQAALAYLATQGKTR